MKPASRSSSRLLVLLLALVVLSVAFLCVWSELEAAREENRALLSERDSLLEEYRVLSSNYSRMEESYLTLSSKHTRLLADYGVLQEAHTGVVAENTELRRSFETLNETYVVLDGLYRDLSAQFVAAQDNITALAVQVSALQQECGSLKAQEAAAERELSTWQGLSIGVSLASYYDYVSSKVGGKGWQFLPNYYQLSANVAAEEAAHDVGNPVWPSLEASSGYYNYTGERSYETSSRIVSRALAFANVTATDNSTVKVDKIMRFASSLIHYERRCSDRSWFPTETLTFRSGDCTSFTILEAAMCEKSGVKAAVGLFMNKTLESHAMLLVHLENLDGYRYYAFDDLASYGLSKGRWIIVEPQYPSLADQEELQDAWIPQWSLVAATEVPYGP